MTAWFDGREETSSTVYVSKLSCDVASFGVWAATLGSGVFRGVWRAGS